MGHIVIKGLNKHYIDRRQKKKLIDRDNRQEPQVLDECQKSDCTCQQEGIIPVLCDINLEFRDGEMVCILGPSGCGKSTLLRAIAGFDTDYQGEILVDGHKVSKPSPDNIFVFQHSSLLPWMTLWENVGLGLREMADKDEMNAKIQEYIEMVELNGFEHHYPHQLSGGMQRRAELGRALAVDPDILFMDEPLSGLDFLTHMKMREEIVNVHEFIKKTIVIVTHDIDDALIMADRIIVFSDRPAQVKLERTLTIPRFPRPRDFRRNEELSKLRTDIYFMLGVNYAV